MRNKIFLKALLALWLTVAYTSNIRAQQNWDTLPWKSYSDFKLQNLNKSYVTTNILYDRMFPLANVDEYYDVPQS